MDEQHSTIEWREFLTIKERFPEARLKADYNREVLDIGVEIPGDNGVWILLKGPQTDDLYELISPEFHLYEQLINLDQVDEIIHSCRDSS